METNFVLNSSSFEIPSIPPQIAILEAPIVTPFRACSHPQILPVGETLLHTKIANRANKWQFLAREFFPEQN